MTGLRQGTIERAIDALWEHGYSVSDVEAGAVLDAILDYLEDHADEWYEATGWSFTEPPLIAALRDPVTVEPD